MGYDAQSIADSGNSQYVGSRSMMAMVGAGIFDSAISPANQSIVDNDENIMVLIEGKDIPDMIALIERTTPCGRWVTKFKEWARDNGSDGIVIKS